MDTELLFKSKGTNVEGRNDSASSLWVLNFHLSEISNNEGL